MKYRMKEVVEAFQMTAKRRWDNSEWPQWLHKAWNMTDFTEGALSIDSDDSRRENLVLGTSEGVQKLEFGDWIVKGIKGALYAMKPDEFRKTFESAEEQDKVCPLYKAAILSTEGETMAYGKLNEYSLVKCDGPACEWWVTESRCESDDCCPATDSCDSCELYKTKGHCGRAK